MQKRIILFIFLILFIIISCDFNSPQPFNPPSWIIGTWEDVLELSRFTFTSDNIVYDVSVNSIGMDIDFKIWYVYIYKAEISEEISDTLYEVTITYQDTKTVYIFEKINTDLLNNSVITENNHTYSEEGPIVLRRID